MTAESRTHLLLYEAEPLLRDSLASALGRLPWLRVSAARDEKEAWDFVLEEAPALSIIDVRLPDRIGLALLSRLRAAFPASTVIVTSAHGAAVEREAVEGGASRFLAKPYRVTELRTVLQELVLRRDTMAPAFASGFEGRLETLSAAEILQATCAAKRTARIELRASDGTRGTIWVRDGEVWDARRGALRAAEAIYALVGDDHGEFRVILEDHDHPRAITTNWQELVLEAARRQDELMRAASEQSAPDPSKRRASNSSAWRFTFDLASRLPPPPSVPVIASEDPGTADAALARAAELLAGSAVERARALLETAAVRWPQDRRLRANLTRLARIRS